MGATDRVTANVAVPVAEQFFRREPVVKLDAFKAATLNPEVVGLFLNFGLTGLVSIVR